MKQTKERIDAYKAMAQSTQPVMEDCVRKHLEENCLKYKGHEDKFDRCIKHLYDTVLEMLGGKGAAVNNRLSGQVPAGTCFKICRDYFDDEIWKAEDEEEAKKKAEKAKHDAERKKSKSKVITASLDDARDDSDDSDDDDNDVPAYTPPKPKHSEGQLDLFAGLGV